MAYIGKTDPCFNIEKDVDYTRTCYPFDFDPKTGILNQQKTLFFNTKADNKTAVEQQNSRYGEPVRIKV